MIDKSEVPFRKGKRVRYTSTGRAFLNTPTLELTGAISNTSDSIQVQYVDVYGNKGSAWVGSSFLEYRDATYDDAIKTLRSKAKDLKAELTKVEAAIETLQNL